VHVRLVILAKLMQYVENWYLLVFYRLRLLKRCRLKFRDGEIFVLNGSTYSRFWKLFWYKVQLRELERKLGFQLKANKCRFTFNGSEVKMYLGDKSSIYAIHSTFIKQVYRRLNVKDRIVIDIGAYIGDTPIYFTLKGARKVIAVEPYPRHYALAKENIALNGLDDRITLLNVAISSRNEVVKLDDKCLCSSKPLEIAKNGIEVTAITLQDLLKMVDENVVVKMDCEGCEYVAILNPPNSLFSRIDEIILEYHGNPTPLVERLRQVGFKVKVKKQKENLGIIYAFKPFSAF